MNKKIGRQTVKFETPPTITYTSSITGPKEGEGPIGKYFDIVRKDILNGCESWEKSESQYVYDNIKNLCEKSKTKFDSIDYIISGDLLNQDTGTIFGIRDFGIPHMGVFGACSTMGESMGLGAILIDGGFARKVIASASSHFCSAEKQFRFPLDLGTQRPPTSTWTVTGDGAVIIEKNGKGPKITYLTTGKIIDMGIKDANNMGAVMAPAAIETIFSHFQDTGRTPDYYDVIATGDLGYLGKDIVLKIMNKKGYDLSKNYTDCGIEIFDKEKQDTHCGGSGCACSAVTFCGYFYKKLLNKEINKILFIPTGALMSTTTSQQGESIPAIAHAIAIENME